MDRTFHLTDGLSVTIVAMIVVFVVLAAIWGLMEIIHRFAADRKAPISAPEKHASPLAADHGKTPENATSWIQDEKRETAAAIAALVQAYEDYPSKKYEIEEVKRIK